MAIMLFLNSKEDEDVVHLADVEGKISQDAIHHVLEDCP